MKKQILLLILSISAVLAFGQSKIKADEKIIPIIDHRDQDERTADKSSNGHKDGDVAVIRFKGVVRPKATDKPDTAAIYQIYFYKMYDSKTEKGKSWLQTYNSGLVDHEDYDKASYSWSSDGILSVTLINSRTNKKRILQLMASGQQAAVVTPAPIHK